MKLSGKMDLSLSWIGFIKRDKILRSGLWTIIILEGLITMTTIVIYGRITPTIPFLYTSPWGESQLVAKQNLWVYCLGLWVGGLAAIAMILGIYKWDQALSRMMIWCTAVGALLALLSIFTVWLKVGY